jgi:hypothetical protein
MYSMIKELSDVSTSQTIVLISILRSCYFILEERELEDTEWIEKHKSGVMAVGRVLHFLGLAEPTDRTVIGWTAKPSFLQLAKDATPALNAEPQHCDTDEPELTKEESVMLDMLNGIATGVLFSDELITSQYQDLDWPEFFQQRDVVLSFTYLLLRGTGLIRTNEEGEFKPNPVLCELFMQGAIRLGTAARESSSFKCA